MAADAPIIKNLDNLRDFVNKTLCSRDQLLIGAFRMTERVLRRNDKPCGIFFCLHGPRAVKFTAVWESERNRVLFYDATGARFHEIELRKAIAAE